MADVINKIPKTVNRPVATASSSVLLYVSGLGKKQDRDQTTKAVGTFKIKKTNRVSSIGLTSKPFAFILPFTLYILSV